MLKIGFGRAISGGPSNEGQDGISLDYDKRLKKPGSIVSGVVKLDLGIVGQKGIEDVTVELVGIVKTRVVVQRGDTAVTYRSRSIFLSQSLPLWSQSTLPSTSLVGYTSLPFTFTLPPESRSLPPSYTFSAYRINGSVQYYIKITGRKAAWYKFNVRIYAPFPFLPYDENPPPAMDIAPRRFVRDEVLMRKGVLFGGQAKVEGRITLPDISSLPLFQDIPITIHVRTQSKPLPASSSLDPSTFTFPLPPLTPDAVELNMQCITFVNARGHTRERITEFEGMGGFGKAGGAERAKIRVDAGQVIWLPEGGRGEKKEAKEGRWCQDVTFNSTMKLTCPPSFDMGILRIRYVLEMKVTFPGLGNTFKLAIDPRTISSGIYFSNQTADAQAEGQLDLPPTYWEVVDGDDDHDYDEKK